MLITRIITVLFLLLSFTSLLYAAEDFMRVEKMMDHNQFEQTGLYKLSPEELEMLNKWLQAYTYKEKEIVRKKTVKAVKAEKVKAKERKLIISSIDGKFTGWSGKTKFRLKNGQVWQQRYQGDLFYNATNPRVEIKRNFLGFYVMHLLGTSYTIGVSRIE